MTIATINGSLEDGLDEIANARIRTRLEESSFIIEFREDKQRPTTLKDIMESDHVV